MLLFYIISIILSLYVGVLFFRKCNLKRVKKSDKELEELCKNNNTKLYYLSYDDKYKLVPIGLPLWGLFLIILISFIPIGIINQIFTNIHDLDVIDVYQDLKSLHASNRYQIIKENVI